MITVGTRVTYEPKDHPVAPWAQAMAEVFEQGRLQWKRECEERNAVEREDKKEGLCQQK